MRTLEIKPTHKVVAAYYDLVCGLNCLDDKQNIIRLLDQVATANLKAMKIVKQLPAARFD